MLHFLSFFFCKVCVVLLCGHHILRNSSLSRHQYKSIVGKGGCILTMGSNVFSHLQQRDDAINVFALFSRLSTNKSLALATTQSHGTSRANRECMVCSITWAGAVVAEGNLKVVGNQGASQELQISLAKEKHGMVVAVREPQEALRSAASSSLHRRPLPKRPLQPPPQPAKAPVLRRWRMSAKDRWPHLKTRMTNHPHCHHRHFLKTLTDSLSASECDCARVEAIAVRPTTTPVAEAEVAEAVAVAAVSRGQEARPCCSLAAGKPPPRTLRSEGEEPTSSGVFRSWMEDGTSSRPAKRTLRLAAPSWKRWAHFRRRSLSPAVLAACWWPRSCWRVGP